MIEDVYSNRIVGYSIQSRMKARIVVDAIEQAVSRRQMEDPDVAGCTLHSYRASQMRAHAALRALRRYDLVGSMGKMGSAGNSAAMVSLFLILQRKVLETRRTWQTRRRPPAGDRDLDRTRLPATTAPRPLRPRDPRRIRNEMTAA